MFSAATRIMRIVGSFACAPRKLARLPLQVSVIESDSTRVSRRRSVMMPGWLRDISETGLGMVVPNIRMGDCYLAGVDRKLRVAIELAEGPVHLNAAPVRYEKIESEGGTSVSYLIGAQITEMSAPDRERITSYLKSLR